jgi:hypothetical protein
MKKLLSKVFPIVLLLASLNVMAANTVHILNASTITSVTGLTNKSITLNVDKGDGASEGTAAKVYIPMATTTTAPTTDYYNLNSTAGPNYNLFGYSTNVITKATYNNYKIDFPLVVSIDSTAKYLYAAVKSASTYVVVANYGSLINPLDNTQFTLSISPQKICEGATLNTTTNCANFDENNSAAVTEAIKGINIYFFVSSTLLAIGSGDIGAPDTTYAGGVYFQANMSNQVFTNSELNISLSNLFKGDHRLIGTMASNSTFSTAYKGTYAYIHNIDTDTCVSVREPGRCQGAFVTDPVSQNLNGEFTLANLPNSIEVTLSVGLIDKFGFSSTLSNSIKGTPTQIQELLKKQACFLLTAGFGEEHYIINFFRQYRDQVLAHTWLGQKFIKVYYGYAPQYALILYQSTFLRWIVRSMAYIMYFFFNFYWIVLIGLVGLSCYYLYFRKKLYNSAQ